MTRDKKLEILRKEYWAACEDAAALEDALAASRRLQHQLMHQIAEATNGDVNSPRND